MNNKLVISLLAILVIVLGAFGYVMSSKEIASPRLYEKEITKVETTSKEDDIDSIEKDLDETDIDNIDQELPEIEAQIN